MARGMTPYPYLDDEKALLGQPEEDPNAVATTGQGINEKGGGIPNVKTPTPNDAVLPPDEPPVAAAQPSG